MTLRLHIMQELDGSGGWHGHVVLAGVCICVGMAPTRDRLIRRLRGQHAARQRTARGIFPTIGAADVGRHIRNSDS